MKMLEAHWTLDQTRITFSFASEGRVDFRPLLQALSRKFHRKIELHQVGVRDEAKMLGGIGRCGRVLCCVTWMAKFENIAVRMAKEQALPISAQNLSGACGRLRCCLRFEYEQYIAMNRDLPHIGEWVSTSYGPAKVIVGHALRKTVSVLLESRATVEVPVNEIVRKAVAPARV